MEDARPLRNNLRVRKRAAQICTRDNEQPVTWVRLGGIRTYLFSGVEYLTEQVRFVFG
jgi:hypothetical protein